MQREPDILDAISRAGLKKRGTLKAWMVANRDAFARKLVGYKPDWGVLAKVFADAGLLDQRGNPPTAESARKTWQRLNREALAVAPPQAAPAPADKPPAESTPKPAQTERDIAAVPDVEDGDLPKIVLKRVTRQE